MKPKEEALFLLPILLFFVHIKSPNPKEPRRLHTTGPKPQYQKPSSRNQPRNSTPNNYK